MKTKYNKIKTTTLMTITFFALLGTTGINAQLAFANGANECAIPPNGMVSWWTGDADASDLIGTNDGTFVDGATTASGKVGNAFSLDGFIDSVDIADSDSLDTGTSFTIDAWFKTNDIEKEDPGKTTQSAQSIVMYGYTDAAGKNNLMKITDGKLQFIVRDGDGSEDLESTTLLSEDVWYHGAYTYNGTHGKLYLNGVEEDSDDTTDINLDANSRVLIGKYQNPATNLIHFDFDGLIDEVEIFDRALNQTEIQAIYDAGSFGKCRTFVEPSSVEGLFHPGDVIDKKLTVLEIPEDGPYDVLVEVTNSTNDPCIDALGNNVLTLTNRSATVGIADTPFMVFYDEQVTGMPGNYHCTVEFIANVTTSSNTYSLANQTAWLDVIGSMGYWNNHPDATEEHLPITLGNETQNFTVDTNETATEIFEDHKGKFGLDKVAAQLLAAALNVWALMAEYDTTCIDPTIASTNNTLGVLGYNGPGGDDPKFNKNNPYLSGLKANHTALDDFNNNGCPVLGS